MTDRRDSSDDHPAFTLAHSVISRVQCRNYRSLEDLDLPIGPLTAIVGPNGAGKTTILNALNLVLGTSWPSMRSIEVPEDFTQFDATRDLRIEVGFSPPLVAEPDALGKAHEIHTLQFRCQPYRRKTKRADAGDLHADFDPLDSKGEVPLYAASVAKGSRPDFRRMNVGTALREQARLLFIDHRRSVVAHLPTARGSALARLLEPARREFERSTGADGRPRKEGFRDAYVAAMNALRTDKLREVEETIATTTKRTLGFMGRRHAHLEVELGIADPANPFHALRIVCREGDLVMPAERQGLGVQSAIVVGIFEALRTIGGDFGSIVIEEPEMYLHPQAQRYFYRLLADLTERGEAQVIYSTHSPVFADPVAFGAIRLARREPGQSTNVTLVEREEDEAYLATRRDSLKILTTFDTTRSEALFAARVLLVEGAADQVAARHVARTKGVDLDGENLAIVACGGKASIPFFARFLRALAIPVTVLHDEDLYDEADAPPQLIADNKNNDRINRDIKEAVGDAARIFVVKPTLEAALGVGRNATDKPLAVLRALQSSLDDDLPSSLRDAVAQLIDGGVGVPRRQPATDGNERKVNPSTN